MWQKPQKLSTLELPRCSSGAPVLNVQKAQGQFVVAFVINDECVILLFMEFLSITEDPEAEEGSPITVVADFSSREHPLQTIAALLIPRSVHWSGGPEMVRWLQGKDVLVSGHQLLDFVLILLISLGKCASCPWSCSPSTAHQAPSLPPASPSHPDDLQPDLTVLLRATSQLCLGCGQQSKLVVQIAIDHVDFNLVATIVIVSSSTLSLNSPHIRDSLS